MQKRVYLDHNATTPLDTDLISALTSTFRSEDTGALVEETSPREGLLAQWGNPSSVHSFSRGPKLILRETRKKLAEIFMAHSNDFIFNSGASEGNTTVFNSVWSAFKMTKPDYLVSAVEHPSIMRTVDHLKTLGANILIIPVNRQGQLDLEFLKKNISEKTALVSVMFANNETGTIFPIKEVIEIAKSKGVLVHSDCVQTLGKIPINFKEFDLNYACMSAHKFYGFKGCGFLYVKKGSPYTNLIFGGAQERFRRGGTENVLGISSLGFMLEKYHQLPEKVEQMRTLRNQMEDEITRSIKSVMITANESPRLPNTSSLLIDGVDGEILLMSLDLDGFAVSTGAACSSGSPEPSPVLLAMGLSRNQAQKSLRISLGWNTTAEQMTNFVSTLKICVERIRDAHQILTESV